VDEETGRIHSVGEPLPDDVPRDTVQAPPGTRPVFPLRPNGEEMIWSLIPASLRELAEKGFARATDSGIQFLNSGTVAGIERGDVVVTGRDLTGAVVAEFREAKTLMPKSVWTRESHNSQTSGTLILRNLIPGRDFPFPKSLYAVEDAIRFFVGQKRDAVVVDFFAGSGTTAHATARLNRQDAGTRQSISITNNEVSESESQRLRAGGHRPGDDEWEALGIFEHITRPRIEAAVTGRTPDGKPVKGDYKFTDEFPMAEGFEENVEFVELTYLDAEDVELNMAFASIAPLLWMRAGSRGPIIEHRTTDDEPLPFAWTDVYAILFDPDEWRPFLDVLPDTASTVFVVTDSVSVFAGVAAELPDGLDVVRLYENYLTTFAINQGGRR
jgi:adenine-specific DNA-methyltransferase